MFDKIPISKLKEMSNGESLLVTGHTLSTPQQDPVFIVNYS